jgi:hypothetical protein
VTQRFQIEDLAAQDASGVVFRALDLETNAVVAVRRFFPFGADGGGLNETQQSAYYDAVERLAGLNHPGLRSVICGGCDPIDGMPFIATEWIPGKSLQSLIERQPLKPADAINVITCALEVCELLSNVLAAEGIWVETDVQTIIVGDEGSARGVTFWISPLKWLRREDERSGLHAIVTLTEEIICRQGQPQGESAGRGLGGWLKWLKGVSKTATLGEAREKLATSTGMASPTPSKPLVRQAAARPSVPLKSIKARKKKSISGTAVAIVLLVLVAAGLGTWAIYRKDPHEPKTGGGLAEIAAHIARENSAKEPGQALSTEMREVAAAMEDKSDGIQEESESDAPRTAAPAVAGAVFSPDDPLLLQQEKRQIVVEGVFEKIELSKSESTIYLMFSKNPARDATRGSILKKTLPDLTEEVLKPLIGKKIRITGFLDVKTIRGSRRPDVIITRRGDIEVVP